ncbi:branched-chain amino acid ABC transporter substrate-binding protein [Chryseobacterium sp.]|uniref:branched-chain amino acid ABC transporter substrate-binding protein n=1 Tax=Chryseobacterium sp. TaxID=1871047 RepID=UPI002897B1E5|nr:branched-chain amino acid ABC transporter substrate-binding protein [Chryseobacterium sp.]
MPFDFLETVGKTLDILGLVIDAGASLPSDNPQNDKIRNSKIKYLAEKTSIVFLILASVLLFFVLKNPFPLENFIKTIIVISLIGLAISFVFFFILYVLEKFYFRSFGQLILFCCSSVILSIALVMFIYFKSGIF